MAIKKYYADKDNTITNAYKSNLITRGTGSNMGAADILEAFVIHGQTSASVTTSPSAANATNAEQSRFIIQFPLATIASDMSSGILPADTGSIKFYLNLYNAPHGNTAPRDFSLDVYMLSQEWTEGRGLDMENYTDLGASSWESASSGTTWTQAGGTYLPAVGTATATVSFITDSTPTALDDGKTIIITNYDGTIATFTLTAATRSSTEIDRSAIGNVNDFATEIKASMDLAVAAGLLKATVSPVENDINGNPRMITLTAGAAGTIGNQSVAGTFITGGGGEVICNATCNDPSVGNGSLAFTGGVDAGSTQKTFSFETGLENLSLDVSDQVYKWLDAVSGDLNCGFLIKFPDSIVSGSQNLYTKKFFSRTSEFFHYRPTLEARWDSTRKDNRGNFFASSSVASAANNLNTLYLYNIVRGQLQNLPGVVNETLTVDIYSGSTSPAGTPLSLIKSGGTAATSVPAGILRENGATITGVYTASFASTSSLDTVFDVWHTGSGASRVNFYTASYGPKTFGTIDGLYREEYLTSITNLEDSYTQGQTPNLRVFARKKNWNPNIYTVATAETLPEIIEDSYYRVHRVVDGLEVIPFGTGSTNNYFSRLSYDVSGNYFELDTSCLEPGYAYGITFAYYLQGEYAEQPEVFKFKIKEEDK